MGSSPYRTTEPIPPFKRLMETTPPIRLMVDHHTNPLPRSSPTLSPLTQTPSLMTNTPTLLSKPQRSSTRPQSTMLGSPSRMVPLMENTRESLLSTSLVTLMIPS